MARYNLISLGCAKNLVDSEVILGAMNLAGWEYASEYEDADVLIINTCGFIQAAVEEGINEILELVKVKKISPEKQLVVVGCLVQRYQDKLAEELPEVDLFIGTEGAHNIAGLLERLQQGGLESRVVIPERMLMNSETPRIISTPIFRAYMKITEGCNNRCSYCMIPSIRGDLRSRSIEDLLREAEKLEKNGVKELTLIAQDITAYGNDLARDVRLEKLLRIFLEKTTIPWFRLMYLYPSGISDGLIELMARNKRILPYLDIPMQHVNDTMLRAMNRRYSSEYLVKMIHNIREKIPDIALRTTFLVGFPGETEKAFLEIEKFLTKHQLDHVGVFPYANEEGSASEKLSAQVPEKERIRRSEHLLSVQTEISTKIQEKYIGRVEPVLVEGLSDETDLLLQGRTKYQAPEVDGCLYINEGQARVGDIVNVRILEAHAYDLVGAVAMRQDE